MRDHVHQECDRSSSALCHAAAPLLSAQDHQHTAQHRDDPLHDLLLLWTRASFVDAEPEGSIAPWAPSWACSAIAVFNHLENPWRPSRPGSPLFSDRVGLAG